jgi:hypothetical protein
VVQQQASLGHAIRPLTHFSAASLQLCDRIIHTSSFLSSFVWPMALCTHAHYYRLGRQAGTDLPGAPLLHTPAARLIACSFLGSTACCQSAPLACYMDHLIHRGPALMQQPQFPIGQRLGSWPALTAQAESTCAASAAAAAASGDKCC